MIVLSIPGDSERSKNILPITLPSIKAWCAKHEVDLVHITDMGEWLVPKKPQCERLKLAPFFDRYERFIYMDDTCIMTPDCPNLFDLVPDGVLGCVVEPFDSRQKWLQRSLDRYGVDRCNGLYFNAGMLVFSQSHRVLYSDIHDLVKRPLWDQDYFNAMVNKYGLPVHDLGTAFNYLGSMSPARLENPAQGDKVYIWHLTTGCPNRLKYGRRINQLIRTGQL